MMPVGRAGLFNCTLLLVAILFVSAVPSAAHLGYGIVVGRGGDVFFLDSIRSRVWKLTPGGQLLVAASGYHANTLVAAPDGSLYFESFNRSLWRLALNGKVERVKLASARDGRAGALDEIIAVDGAGNFYFSAGNDFVPSAPQILKRAPSGEVTVFAGSVAGRADGKGREAQFQEIRAAAWGRDGALYVTDRDRVRRVASDGAVTTLALRGLPAETGGWFGRLYGIAVDSAGNVYVADAEHRRVYRIAPSGEATVVAESEPSWTPIGVAVAEHGVYILERTLRQVPATVQARMNSPRIRRVFPDGRVETAAIVRGLFLDAVSAAIPWVPPMILLGTAAFLAAGSGLLSWAMLRRRRRRLAR